MTGPEPPEPSRPPKPPKLPPDISPGSRFVAMGSSFAAGPGIGRRAPGSPRAAGRSSANYAHLVARRLALELDDVTFSGATTQDILAATAAGRPAQIDAVTPATKLVTLTGGGNDVGWAPRILLSSLPRPVRAIPPVRRQLDSYADPDLTEQRFGTLRENLLKIAAEVRRRAPESRLVFVDYLTVLPPDGTTPTGVLPAGVAEWGRAVARRLSGITRDVAAQSGSVFVAASAASANHHAWSATPWTRRFHLSLRGGAPYHPNAAGMAAVAELVAAALPPRLAQRDKSAASP
jgi:lysophospholipase L1-like esterase